MTLLQCWQSSARTFLTGSRAQPSWQWQAPCGARHLLTVRFLHLMKIAFVSKRMFQFVAEVLLWQHLYSVTTSNKFGSCAYNSVCKCILIHGSPKAKQLSVLCWCAVTKKNWFEPNMWMDRPKINVAIKVKSQDVSDLCMDLMTR